MTPPERDAADDVAVQARLLTALAVNGIVLTPEQQRTALADSLVLARQMRLIRAAADAEAPLPLGLAVPPPTA